MLAKPIRPEPNSHNAAVTGTLATLHAGAAAKAHERNKLEQLCRNVSRPALSEQRLSLTPNSKHRAWVTPAMRGKGSTGKATDAGEPTSAERRTSMTWAQRLNRVFHIGIETCCECCGAVRIIACIEDPGVRYSLT